VNVDRETPMSLPIDLREWVPEDDLVHFVISAVETMNLPTLTVNQRGSGSRQYTPRMMLAGAGDLLLRERPDVLTAYRTGYVSGPWSSVSDM
jgi:hypothetical protein